MIASLIILVHDVDLRGFVITDNKTHYYKTYFLSNHVMNILFVKYKMLQQIYHPFTTPFKVKIVRFIVREGLVGEHSGLFIYCLSKIVQ
jgi:hypothetical protein